MGTNSVLQIHTDPAQFIEAVAERTAEILRPFLENTSTPTDPRPLTRREAAHYLGISVTTLTDRENKGLVKGYRTGNRRLYKREDLDASLLAVRRTVGHV